MLRAEFIKSVYDVNNLPKEILPEVILAGRSNVGKSSFINSIVNERVALISSTPGKTQAINYYKTSDNFYIVDLPGFGYSKAGKELSLKWKELITRFFLTERGNRVVLHLVDSRHKPTELDIIFCDFINRFNYDYLMILNKSDKLKKNEFPQVIKRVKEVNDNSLLNENMFFYSAITKQGKKEIIKKIYSHLN